MLALELMLVAFTAAAPGDFETLGAAATALAEDRETDAALARLLGAGKKGLWALADTAKKSEGSGRARLFEAMGRFKGPDAEWALLVELKRADPETRAGILRGLAHLRNPKNYRHIIAGADSTEAVVRDAAVDALVEVGMSAQDLEALLANASPSTREAALKYLVRAGKGDVLDRSIGPALRDPVPAVQLQGIALVVKKSDPAHTRELLALATGRDPTIALAAVDAIAVVRRDNAAYDLAVVAADGQATEQAWKKAADILRDRGGRSLAALVEASEKASEKRAEELAAIVTRDIAPEQMAELVDMIGDRSVHRAKVGRAMLDKAGQAGLEAAYQRLLTSKGELRRVLLEYLRERWPDGTGARLVELAKTGELERRVVALELLARLRHEPSLVAAQEQIGDVSPDVRAAAALVIAAIPNKDVVRALGELARDREPKVRIAALKGLEQWVRSDDHAIAVARAALLDPKPEVREAAIHVLSEPRDPMVLDALKERLREAPPRERAAIAAALAKSKLPGATVLLVNLAADKNSDVQQSAIEALKH